MTLESHPSMIDNRFVLPLRTLKTLEDTEVSEYIGVKYLAVPALLDRIGIKIEGKQILEYDAVSNKICNCFGIDEFSISLTDEIECHYRCLGEGNYSCQDGPLGGPPDPERMRFIIVPCHVTTQISRKKGKFDCSNFTICKNWDVEIIQSKDGEDRSSTESLMWNSDFYYQRNLMECFRFLLPKWIDPVRCDAAGRPDKLGIYQWHLTYDVRGFVKEWLRAHNPGAFRISWSSEHDEECFVVSNEYVPGKYVKLE